MANSSSPGIIPASEEIKTLLDTGRLLHSVIKTEGREPFVLVPKGYERQPLDPKLPEPLDPSIKQRVTFRELESYIRYTNDFKVDRETRIFASIGDSANFTTIFDFHKDKAGVDRLWHRASYSCPDSLEWALWKKWAGQPMDQEAFALFIERNARDVSAPETATLVEMALNFQAKSNVDFSSEIGMQNGQRVLKYSEIIEGGRQGPQGTMKVPDTPYLSIPIFEGDKLRAVEAKLAYRVNSGKLRFHYDLVRPQIVVREAVKELVAAITEKTGIEPLMGSIE